MNGVGSFFKNTQFNSLLKSSLTLLVLNLTGAAFHYLFQVLAVRRLDVLSYGELNTRISSFSVIMSVGICAQFIPVLLAPRFHQIEAVFKWTPARKMVAFSWFTVVFYFIALIFFKEWAVSFFLPLSVMLYLCVHFWLGVLQSMQRFFFLGLGSLGLAFFKMAGGFKAQDMIEFQMAIPFAGAALLLTGLLAATLFWGLSKIRTNSDSEGKPTMPSQEFSFEGLLFPFLIGFGTVFLPIYDLFNVQYFLKAADNATALGEYSRLMLFSKILYHAPQTLLQVTLPHYVSAFAGDLETRKEKRKQLLKLERLGLFAVYFLGLAFAIVGPWGAEIFLNIPAMSKLNIFLACMAVPPLYGLLSSLQIFGAQKRAPAMLALLLMILFSPLLVFVLKIQDLTAYLVFSAVINSIFGFLAMGYVKKELFKA